MKGVEQPSKTLRPGNVSANILQLTHTAALELRQSTEFSGYITEILTQLKSTGLSFSQFSVYLMEENGQGAVHYFLAEQPIGWEHIVLTDAAELEVFANHQPKMWQGPVSEQPLWFLSVPFTRSVVTIADHRARRFTKKEIGLVTRLVLPLEHLIIRHRDLHALEMAQAQRIETDEDLLALHDGSYDLSGEDQDEVIQKIIQIVITKLQFDRAGIFLKEDEHNLLRGTWGVDEKIAIVPIRDTTFPLAPENKDALSEAALIALGKRAYFLTQDLDSEGRRSVEGHIEASACVPMRVGDHIIGVLAVDNYFTHQPIAESQVQPLMILANQGAVALENAQLYHALQHAHDDLDEKVEERTAQLAQALQEKEILLKEVSHRVKNNLMVIDALLNLQLGSIEDEQARRKVQESKDRVHSMVILHEALHQSNDLRTISLNEYLHQLITDVFASYRLDNDTIALKVQIEKIDLGVDQAITCGLILNELISNALKYAFPGNQTGEISLDAQSNEKNEVILTLGDNGIGIPSEIDIQRTKSMGMQVVKMLVQQLRGSMKLHQSKGTEFVITFPRFDPSDTDRC
jgi:two-component sensor histidine kinase